MKVDGVFVIVVPLHWVLLPKENLVALYLLKENATLLKKTTITINPLLIPNIPSRTLYDCFQSGCNHIIVNVGAVNCIERKIGSAWWVMENFINFVSP